MDNLIVILKLITFGTPSPDGALVIPCKSDDLPCLKNSSHLFLKNTQHGLPLHNIRPIDPLVIQSAQYPAADGASYKFSNVTVSGMKDLIVSDFKMDMNAKSVVLTKRGNLTITGKLEIVPIEPGPVSAESELFTARALSTVINKYNYELKKNGAGVEHFDVGPGQFECKVEGPVNFNLGQSKDKDLPEDVLCSLIKEANQVVFQNLREAAKIIPAKEFITNIS